MKKLTIVTLIALLLNILMHIESLWSLFNLVTQKTGVSVNYSVRWIEIVSFLGIFIALSFLIYKYQEIRELMKVNNFIYFYRNKNRFIEQFDGIEFYKLPDESAEEFFKKTPEGMYNKELIKEYLTVLNRIIKELGLKEKEAIKLLNKAYNYKHKKEAKNSSLL